jgi:hypothetical protein
LPPSKPNDQVENTQCCDNSFRRRCRAGVRSTDPSWPVELSRSAQLAQCIKKAKKLDEDRDQFEIIGTTLSSQTEVDQSSSAKDKRDKFNASLEMHNSEVIAYNAECTKKYYAEDLTAAQELGQRN